jgi:AraC-like DNA-binding protein
MKEFVHMSKCERTLFGGAEWPVNTPLWVVLQLDCGVAYARSGQMNEELAPGSALVIPPDSPTTVLASLLGGAGVRGFSIKIGSLYGLLTVTERTCLEGEAAQGCAPFRQLPASHPLAIRLGQCLQNGKGPNLPARLGLMQAFAEWLLPFLEKSAAKKTEAIEQDPKARLQRFLNRMPESELSELSLGDLAKDLCCCERHASRLFHEVCGCGFRKYVSELRLKKACQMLAQSDYKIIDVAMDSGHSSLAQFNYTFKNRFRMTPSEWRERHLPREGRGAARGLRVVLAA